MLERPDELHRKTQQPIAILLDPDVLHNKVSNPIAVL